MSPDPSGVSGQSLFGGPRPLPLTMPIGERETPSDYLSRLSYRNGRDGLNAICRDFGIDAQAVFWGERAALEKVAALSGHDAVSLGQHAFRKLPQGRLSYRGEVLNPYTAPTDLVRACAGCIEDDLRRWDFRVEARPFRRAEWQVEALRTCPVHSLSLVRIGRGLRKLRKDTSRFLAGAVRNPSDLWERSAERPASRFEVYLLGRLAGVRSVPWLDALPLFAAIQTCAMLGSLELHGPDRKSRRRSDDERRDCEDAGFAVASQGESGIRMLLDRMQAQYRSSSREWGAGRILGFLYRWLARPDTDVAFEPLRDIVRNHCFDTLPIGAGRTLLGQTLAARRVHSITSASLEFGISTRRLRHILTSKGLVAASTSDLPPDKVTFDAPAAEPMLRDASELMGTDEMLAFVGVSPNSNKAFLESGLLPPWHRGHRGGLRTHLFRRTDVEAFAARLRAKGRSRLADSPDLADLPAAAQATQFTAVRIAQALLAGELCRVGLRPGLPAWMAVLVDPAEVISMLRARDTGYRTMGALASQLGVNARVMGALVKVGAIQPITVDHPFLGRTTPFVPDTEVARFAETYVKLGDLAKRLRTSGRALRPRLSAAGIEPAFAFQDLGLSLYRWEDVRRWKEFS